MNNVLTGSVLIKGMEMPNNCQDCPLNYDQMACIVTGTRWWSDTIVLMNFDSEKERLYDCPLIEVKTPHGRLIDADEIEIPCLETTADQKWMEIAIKSAPTVIEAEGREK